jgi:hypothetical protein
MIKPNKMRWVWQRAHTEEIRNTHTILIRKTEGRTPLDRPKHRWKYNTKTDSKEIRCEYVDKIIWLSTVL